MQVSKNLAAIQNKINSLEKAGFEVILQHYNNLEEEEINGNLIQAETHFVILHREIKVYVTGVAICSKKDSFSKQKGTQIAFNRAVHNLTRTLGREKVKLFFDYPQ